MPNWTGLLPAACAIALLAGCDQVAAERTAAKDDRPDAGAAPAAPKENQALIDATPQESLSAEDREEFRRLARGYLDDSEDELAKGYTRVDGMQDEIAAMQPTQSHAWEVSLRGGEVYRVIGACDNECQDMDLELIDRAGKIVERDSLPDDAPVLNITPRADARYTVRMTMKTCTIGPCYAAARVYRRTGAAAEGPSNAA